MVAHTTSLRGKKSTCPFSNCFRMFKIHAHSIWCRFSLLQIDFDRVLTLAGLALFLLMFCTNQTYINKKKMQKTYLSYHVAQRGALLFTEKSGRNTQLLCSVLHMLDITKVFT